MGTFGYKLRAGQETGAYVGAGKVDGGIFTKFTKPGGIINMFKQARFIKIFGFSALLIFSLFAPFGFWKKFTLIAFVLILASLSFGTTNLLECITNKFKKNRDN
ncbi:hypothetical protein BACCIP111899_02630 [Bacillus rhizoplanae]|uniref:Uncharacterized protein n=1 Tax=Bacillus rhizoplanae TaxID=2880966 RepID=A0ABM8YCM1_9BACI|nr:hypothetical protein [Bacillus rhizoplanae]CAG9613415.1 hypothetical protein BACCIP111899_02630 [Bacillus rhizoplanae]